MVLLVFMHGKNAKASKYWAMLICMAGMVAPLSAATFGLFTYTDGGTSITITDYPTTETGAVVIPDTIDGKPVTSIGSYAFRDCSGLTSITIPSSVTSIGSLVFQDCRSLTAISVDPSNASYSSFDGVLCDKLLTTLIQCPGGYNGSFTIPDSVTSIYGTAFLNCSSLTAILVDPSNANFSSINGVLHNKLLTTLIKCPGGYNGSFTIPASVGGHVFSAFYNCSSLTAISVDPSNANYSSINGVLCDKLLTTLIQCPGGYNGSFTIPSSVTSISSYAFQNCSGLTSITIPSSVTSIPSFAFHGCSGLTSVTIPSSVTSISSYAFQNCSGLTRITIPSSVISIGDYAFSGCSGLTSVTIPASVTSIGGYMFFGCSGLTSITIPASVTSIGGYAFNGCSSLNTMIFLGAAPSLNRAGIIDSVSGANLNIYYFNNATGFTSPTWNGYPSINMGDPSPMPPWLLVNDLPHDSDIASDHNGDGVTLLMAYALDLNPHNAHPGLPNPTMTPATLGIEFYASAPGITYTAQTSDNLSDWVTEGITLSEVDSEGKRTASVTRDSSRRFIRLMVGQE
jgi:hypothetical protein